MPRLLLASNSQALQLWERSRVSLRFGHQPQKIHLHKNLFEGAFSSAEIAPPENAFFPPAAYNASKKTARGYLSATLPIHSLPQLIPRGSHGLVPTPATCYCHCPSSKWVCSSHWSCSYPFRAGMTPPGCSPEPGHTSDKHSTDTDPHSALTL